MATDIELVQTALTEFDKVSAGLAVLNKNYAGILFEVDTPKGMEHAKAARKALREPRFEIERIRKEAKAPLLSITRKLDSEAARITGEIMKLEDPIHQQIKNEEDRKEREKAEAAAAEAKRVSDLQNRIAGIRNMAMIPASCGSEAILARHDATKALPLEGFAELTAEATAAKEQTVAILFGLHSSALAAEAEAAKVAREREELTALRAENERLAKIERDRLAEEERVARVAREAEQAAQAEELRRERAEMDRERAAQEQLVKDQLAKLATERAEQDRVAQAERDRLAAEARQQAEANAREAERMAGERRALEAAQEAARIAAMPKPAATKRPSDAEIVQVVADHFGVEPGVAMGWLASFTNKAQKAA